MKYKIEDVMGDGSCFFRSIYQALFSTNQVEHVVKSLHNGPKPPKVDTEDKFVRFLRSQLAKRIVKKDDMNMISEIYNHLQTLDEQTYQAIIHSFPEWFQESFPDGMPKTETTFRNKIVKQITNVYNWAGQIEVTLTQQIFTQVLDINIHIFNHSPKTTYRFATNTLYLLNKGEVHYVAILPQYKTTQATSTKMCPPEKILNKLTNRCVLRTSCKGLEIIVKKYEESSP